MRASLLLCFVIAASSVSAVSIRLKQDQETICLGQENFLRIGAEDSCLQYYQCYAGRAYLMQCPQATWFNENEQICDSSDPPVGCEVEGDPRPEPEPEPEETEESEEEEDPENPLPEDLGLTADDGSGDLEPTSHHDHHHDSDEGSGDALEERILELFETFLIKLQQENEVDQIPQLQVEDNEYENLINENPRIIKFPNAYQVYKQEDVETDALDIKLEEEDLIRIIVNELKNQQESEFSRRKRQTEEINEINDEDDDDNAEDDDDNDEDQNIDKEEEEEQKAEGDGSDDENQQQETEENEDNDEPEDVEAENPDDVEEAEENLEETTDDTEQKHHHHHQNDDASIQDILQESEDNKESKAKGFFKRLFRINA